MLHLKCYFQDMFVLGATVWEFILVELVYK